MIYILTDDTIQYKTDSYLNYIPTDLTIYLDDKFICKIENESTDNEFIIFTYYFCDLEVKEYKLKIYDGNFLVKEELIVVQSNDSFEFNSINNITNIKMYDK